LPLPERDRPGTAGRVRPRSRGASPRGPDRRAVRPREGPVRASQVDVRRGALPPAGRGAPRLAGSRDDVRAVPLLRAARGDRARAAGGTGSARAGAATGPAPAYVREMARRPLIGVVLAFALGGCGNDPAKPQKGADASLR